MYKTQTIEIDGKKVVLLHLEDYEELLERAEMLEDIEDFDKAMAGLAAGEEVFPADLVDRLTRGESPVRAYREYRGLSQRDLAVAADVSIPAISKIESTGKASVATLAAIAKRLDVTVDDLIQE